METAFPYRYILWLFGVAKYQRGDKAEARGTNEKPMSVKPLLIQYGETCSAWKQQFKDIVQKFVLKR